MPPYRLPTLRSLLAQTVPPARVIVMADNCTDRTVERARAAGAEVQETVANTAKFVAGGTILISRGDLAAVGGWRPVPRSVDRALLDGRIDAAGVWPGGWGAILESAGHRKELCGGEALTTNNRMELTAVIEARAKATSIQVTPETLNNPEAFNKFQQAQGELSSALSRLLVVSERYPDLKANQNMMQLSEELSSTENRIAALQALCSSKRPLTGFDGLEPIAAFVAELGRACAAPPGSTRPPVEQAVDRVMHAVGGAGTDYGQVLEDIDEQLMHRIDRRMNLGRIRINKKGNTNARRLQLTDGRLHRYVARHHIQTAFRG